MNKMSKPHSNIYVFALDSAEPNIVESLITEDKLPNLKSLRDRGTMAKLKSAANGFSDAPWLSFNTGVNPGKHGCYNFLEFQRDTREIHRVGANACPTPFFWSLLAGQGKKIGLFDVPKTVPVGKLEGIQISGWGEEYPLVKSSSLPANTLGEINRRFGKYRHPREILNPRFVSQQMKRYLQLLRAVEQKMNAIKFVLEQEEQWDLFMTSFGEAHYANHLFYHLYERNHWAYNSELASSLDDAIPKIYSELDAAVGKLIERIPAESTVIVLSVHGVSTNYSANHLLPEVLNKLGYQEKPKAVGTEEKKKVWRDHIPMPIRDMINDWLVPQRIHDKMHSQQFIDSIDWNKSKAFALPLGHFQGFVSVNLAGRDSFGNVAPENYNQVCQQIIDDLMGLINPDSGKPAIKEIFPIAQLVTGERIDRLPDLVIRWAEDVTITRLHHPKFGSVSSDFYGLRKTQHTGNGFIIAGGGCIKQGAKLSDVRETDLAPTILHLMGQKIPEYMDGNVLEELLESSATVEQEC